jgi:hypothetical protein
VLLWCYFGVTLVQAQRLEAAEKSEQRNEALSTRSICSTESRKHGQCPMLVLCGVGNLPGLYPGYVATMYFAIASEFS